ncbi:MAG: transglycosylase domain-containing protein [Chloroflexi bacterium]|nr:transglycosylase domain-containing protein [Chloroflexota bacterium]
MPDEHDYIPDDPRETEDDDVPFHLPKTDDYREPDDDETDDLWNAANAQDARNMPTMPVTSDDEDDAPIPPRDTQRTLPGSGGLDPNPDFAPGLTQRHQRVEMQQTMPHNVSSYNQPTMPVEQQRFARPAQPTYPQQPGYVPPAPQTGAAPKPALPPRQAQARPRRILGCAPGCVWVIVGFLAIFCGGSTLLAAGLSIWGVNRVEALANERLKAVETYQNFQSTFFYDREGRQLYEVFNEGRRTNVDYASFPQSLIDATIAIEDDNFWTNPGIDPAATLRAFAQYIGIGGRSTGGSTITQQLVRNVLFSYEYRAERSVQRKVEEILLALVLTQRMSKQDILEMYLNEIYYGNLAYGAEAAAQTFFGKSVSELTLGEAALLAALPQAPAELDPLNPDPAIQEAVAARWRLVLDRMVLKGFITEEQKNEALRQGLTYVSPAVSLKAPHFTVYAQNELERLMTELGYSPEQIAKGGLRVYTTLDLDLNEMVLQAMQAQIARLTANNVSNAATVVLKPITGEILAMVGSVDYNNDAIDGRVNVAVSPRQPGSTMKPFTYSAAMEAGMTPGDVIWDVPTRIGLPGQEPYVPVNYDRSFHGPMTMRYALANSYNIPAVQTLRRVGVESLLAMMRRVGVESLSSDASQYGLSLTLGGGEVTLLEFTNAFAVFANSGLRVPATGILCVVDNDDNILYQYENQCPRGNATGNTVSQSGLGRPVLDPRISFIISDILGDNAARSAAMGSNSPLYTPGIATSVKTGTTNDVKDNWTVGYTRNVAVGVWVGNSRGEPMVNTSGLTGAAPIWNTVFTTIYNNQDFLADFAVNGQLFPDQQEPPQGVSLREICDVRSLQDPATDCRRFNEWFLDSPAAIPDENGNLYYPPAQPSQEPPIDPNQPALQEVSPSVFRVLVYRLNPGIASAIQFPVAPGQPVPPPPLYCQVPVSLDATARSMGAQDQLFIAPPPVPDDAISAEQYARNNNLAFLPTVACSPELLQGGGQQYGPTVTTAIITSPAPGQVLTQETPIIGTVQFPNDGQHYYKLEVIGGSLGDWTTIGTIHTENVVNGQLENLYVPGLTPGDYRLRLVIVQGAGFLQAPYEVPFRVER